MCNILLAHVVCVGRFVAGKANVPMIAYSATADELMDLGGAPPMTVVRTCTNDLASAAAVLALVTQFGWKYVDVLYVHDSFGRNFFEGLQRIAEMGACASCPCPAARVASVCWFENGSTCWLVGWLFGWRLGSHRSAHRCLVVAVSAGPRRQCGDWPQRALHPQ